MRKKLKISFNAPVVLIFVGICLVATLLGMLTGDKSTELLFMVYHSSLTNPLTYIRFFTHVFGHAGWEHFMGNISYLLLLGPLLEEKYGPRRMILIITITALTTGIINYVFFPSTGLCGASGVVFAFILLASFTGFNEGEIPLTFLLVVVIFVGQQIYQGVTTKSNVSYMAHMIGGVIGAVAGYLLNRKQAATEGLG